MRCVKAFTFTLENNLNLHCKNLNDLEGLWRLPAGDRDRILTVGPFDCMLSISCLNKKKEKSHKEALVVPSATGKLRRSKLGRGRNGAPNYKVTRENQSPVELSWHWRHRTRETADQWVSLHGEAEEKGGEREKEEEGGVRAGYCSEKSVPCCVQISPLSCA